jgi:branched-chain amino acid transport system ATP-binding protein
MASPMPENAIPANFAPVLAAEGLHAHYGASHVIHGVDFSVGRGETVGLMGRNGMGKTTLLRSMLGFVRPSAGSVRICGRDMTRAEPHRVARAGVAYVPEGRGIFFNLSVRENLVMAARAGCGGRSDWDLARVLDIFPRLAERLTHGGAQLSGGEQQMLSIARALLTNPDVLLLDEVTEGLAPLIAREIWNLIRSLRVTGVACVIVDKNHAAVTAIADRCVLLVKGRALFDGSSASLREQPGLLKRHLGV